MGSTVCCGKLAAAFKTTDGEIAYVLFEQTFEKNVYPHQPRWGACFIGSFQDCLQWALRAAVFCYDGGLQARNGRILPWNYVDGWIKAMQTAVAMSNIEIEMTVSESFRATVPANRVAEVAAALNQIGRGKVADDLIAGNTVRFLLFDDPDLAIAVYGKAGIGTWRAFDFGDALTVPSEHRVQRKRVRDGVPDTGFEIWRVGCSGFVVRHDGATRYYSSAMSFLLHWFCEVVFEAELDCQGCFKMLMREAADRLESAVNVPPGGIVKMVRMASCSTFQKESFSNFAVAIGLSPDENHLPGELQCRYGELNDDAMRYMGYVDENAISFDLDETIFPATATCNAMLQSSLF